MARRLLLDEEALGQALDAAPPPLDVDAVLARAAAAAGPGPHPVRATRTSTSFRRWGAAALAASVAALLLIAHERSPRPGQSGPGSPSTTFAAGAPVPTVASAPGHDVAVIPTDNPNITVVWYF